MKNALWLDALKIQGTIYNIYKIRLNLSMGNKSKRTFGCRQAWITNNQIPTMKNIVPMLHNHNIKDDWFKSKDTLMVQQLFYGFQKETGKWEIHS